MALKSIPIMTENAKSHGSITAALLDYEEMPGGNAFIGQNGAAAAATIIQQCHGFIKILENALVSDNTPEPYETSIALGGVADLLALAKVFVSNE